jgi:hypothetical protein
MSRTASWEGQTRSGVLGRASAGWIESPAFDLVLLALVPLTTAPIALAPFVAASPSGIGLSVVAFLLATAHYLSTFAFYFWDENRDYHRVHWRAFFGGPLVLAAGFVAILALRVDVVILFTLFLWNTYHVARQSCGLVSLYRHRAGVTDPSQKNVTNLAIVATNFFMALWNIESFVEVQPILAAVGPRGVSLIRTACGLVAALALVRLARALRTRSRAGQSVRGPELAMLTAGLLMFHPYLWFPDTMTATFAMLAPHYLQYLALLWLLHRRRFTTGKGSSGAALLRWISASTPHLCLALLVLSVPFLVARSMMGRLGWAYQFSMLYMLLAFVHFYLDSLFWAFKQPHVRRTLGPYLTPRPVDADARAV